MAGVRGLTMSYTTRPLDAATWDAFAELVERNNGIFGGCWCIGYHPECGQRGISHRAVKEDRVRTGRAHAALVLDEDGVAQGWCQYGSPEELPGIKHRREYDKDAPPLPDWRITCFYVDRKHRGLGIARVALEGALDQIAQAGGGLVEAIPEVTDGRVAQGRFLFSTTVMENVRFGRPGATDEEVMAAIRLANADSFVERLPEKYQTVLGERGSGLSQGQRQLLSIARAALAEPRILILDEATSSVDTRTERLIQRAFDELLKGRSAFVIAHRLSTIRNADVILVLKDGQIIERGHHDELLAKEGFYYDLYMSQFKKHEDAQAAVEATMVR